MNLLIFNPKSTNLSVRCLEYANALGPSFIVNSPINILEFKYTPVANITALASYLHPNLVTTPVTTCPSCNISTTSSITISILGLSSKVFFISVWYLYLSACPLKEWTAGPLAVFNILLCISVLSAFIPICPPKASISFTNCPFPVPPIDGLQGIKAIESKDIVTTNVLWPILAVARAASQPACPAPTTITSYFPASNCFIWISFLFYVMFHAKHNVLFYIYLPIQKFANIVSNKSSLTVSPFIYPK